MTLSQSRAGKPRLRGERGMCSPPRALEGPSPSVGLPGYWTVTGFRAIVSRVTPSPLRKPIIYAVCSRPVIRPFSTRTRVVRGRRTWLRRLRS